RFDEALGKVRIPGEPGEIEPGRYTVVLEEMAVSFLWHVMAFDGFSALALEQGRSFFTDSIGKKVTGENITIHDNIYHPLIRGVPFDYEGVCRQEVPLIDKGVAMGVTHNRRTAGRSGRESTGHSLPPGVPYGPFPRNLVMEPGTVKRNELIKGVDKGILITRLWYVNTRDERQALLTGMTRGGTFWIENGVPVRPLKNLRFNEKVLDAFSRCSGISDGRRVCASEFGGHGAFPCVRLEDFHITGCSKSL
ncbi:MAG: metallopeptidase TldD-related protein, partial [bacterium]|nr:metallopeptidase TldD-related protein [bacterium]